MLKIGTISSEYFVISPFSYLFFLVFVFHLMFCCESCFIIHSKAKSFTSLFSSLLLGLNMDQPEGLHSTANIMQKAGMTGTSRDRLVQTAVCSALNCAFQGPVRSCYFQSERSHRTNYSNAFLFVHVGFFSACTILFRI